MSDSVSAGLSAAPDWATWADNGNMAPPVAPSSDASVGPDGYLASALKRLRELMPVTAPAQPGSAAAAVAPALKAIANTPGGPQGVDPMTGNPTSMASPEAPPLPVAPPAPVAPATPAPPPAAPAPPPAAPAAAPAPIVAPQVAPLAKAQALLSPPPVDTQAAKPDVSQGDQGTLNIKRNNPLNIRYVGQPGTTNVGGFAQYPTVQDGYNAADNLMANYAKGGINTLTGLISKWAPPSENNTASYIATVSKATGIDPNTPINLADPAVRARILPAMARVESGVGGGGGEPAPASPGPTIAATESQPAASSVGIPTNNAMDPVVQQILKGMYTPQQLSLNNSNKLLALAGGLLSGHGPADAFGKGLSALSNANMQDLENKRAINAQSLQAAGLLGTLGYRNQMLGVTGARLDQQGNAPAGPQQIIKNPDGTLTYQTPLKNGSFRMDNGPSSAVQGTENRSDVGLQSALTAGKAGAGVEAKDTQEDINDMLDKGANAGMKSMQLNQLQQLVSSGQAGTGPGLAAAKRNIANYFGIDIGDTNPSGSQLAQAIASQTRGSGIMGKNMRTQKEFNTVFEGLPNMDQNPQALTGIINGLKNINDFQQQAASDWLALPQDQRTKLRGDQDAFQNWQQSQLQQWRQRVEKGGGLYGQSSTLAPQAAGQTSGPLSGSYNGVKWSFTPN